MPNSLLKTGFIFAILLSISLSSCTYSSTRVYKLDHPENQSTIEAPTKAHLYNGSMILFSEGFQFKQNVLSGSGIYYDLQRKLKKEVKSISADSVAFLEYYQSAQEGGPILGSLIAPLIFAGAVGSNDEIKKAIFGSCPTVYSYNGTSYSLQAECFSYSICPMAEDKDLDRIDKGTISDNSYVLKVTNEALETHYINEMNLIYAEYPSRFEAFPSDDEDIILFGQEQEISSAKDKAGRDILPLISNRDRQWFRSDSSTLQQLCNKVTKDWIDLTLQKPRNAQKMFMAIRLRNTLLNTVLFYDVMLGSGGVRSLDLVEGKSIGLLDAWNFNNWYTKYFGLEIQIWDGEEFETIGRIKDTGPIAWHQVGIRLPTLEGKKIKLRLTFLPDNWVIDWVGISFDQSDKLFLKEIPCKQLLKLYRDTLNLDAAILRQNDDQYLITYPAESYLLTYEVSNPKPDINRSYFLKSQGYYIEWIRNEWFNDKKRRNFDIAFELNEKTLIKTAKRWSSKKEEFEHHFFSSKITKLAE
jgi:hypothetical protein